jgi:hypothetical protein
MATVVIQILDRIWGRDLSLDLEHIHITVYILFMKN